MIRPALVPAIIVGMTLTFNQFNVIYFVSGGGPLHPNRDPGHPGVPTGE